MPSSLPKINVPKASPAGPASISSASVRSSQHGSSAREWCHPLYRTSTTSSFKNHRMRRMFVPTSAHKVTSSFTNSFAGMYQDTSLNSQEQARIRSERGVAYRKEKMAQKLARLNAKHSAKEEKRLKRMKMRQLRKEIKRVKDAAATSLQAMVRANAAKKKVQAKRVTRDNNACSVIQRRYRSHVKSKQAKGELARRRCKAKEDKSARSIQRHARNMADRKRAKAILERKRNARKEELESLRNEHRERCATRIQSIHRGRVARSSTRDHRIRVTRQRKIKAQEESLRRRIEEDRKREGGGGAGSGSSGSSRRQTSFNPSSSKPTLTSSSSFKGSSNSGSSGGGRRRAQTTIAQHKSTSSSSSPHFPLRRKAAGSR